MFITSAAADEGLENTTITSEQQTRIPAHIPAHAHSAYFEWRQNNDSSDEERDVPPPPID